LGLKYPPSALSIQSNTFWAVAEVVVVPFTNKQLHNNNNNNNNNHVIVIIVITIIILQ
jgi:hypothetical protein